MTGLVAGVADPGNNNDGSGLCSKVSNLFGIRIMTGLVASVSDPGDNK